MALPVEVVLGVYLGVLTGVLPALVAWALGFVFRYVTGVTIPGFAVVGLGVALAGVNGGLLGLTERAVASSPTLVTAVLVVLMMTLYAHNRGDAMGATFPRRVSLRGLRTRRLSRDVVELVGGARRVRVAVAGDVADMEGYPPLPPGVRAAVGAWSATFPADLPLSELERRVGDRLRSEFDLADVAVALDERARATVVAAPPTGGLSRRVPDGQRAASSAALLPTGLARGDEVTLETGDAAVDGTVVSARTDGAAAGSGPTGATGGTRAQDVAGADTTSAGETGTVDGKTSAAETASSAGVAHSSGVAERAPTTTGGDGRITVALARADAPALLSAERARVVVQPRGTRREYELLSLLRGSGHHVRRVAVAADGPLAGSSLGGAGLREAHGVAVLAHRSAAADGERPWRVAPRGETPLAAGDELFVVGTADALDRFTEAVT